MTTFKDYAKYYNLIYKDKDYRAEAAYIADHIREQNPNAKSILNLGCGTGNHDFIFAEKNFHVTGIDLSHNMVEIANSKKNARQKASTQFLQGDIRKVRINKKFDTVISLFHVMSYQTSNEDLERTFITAYEHLDEGGAFIFDFWYGPGVLTDRPSLRNKTFEDDSLEVQRYSTPVMHINDNIVDVNFSVSITEKISGTKHTLEELHRMRYLFIPELKYFIQKTGFQFELAEEWLTGNALSDNSWNALVICKK